MRNENLLDQTNNVATSASIRPLEINILERIEVILY